MKQSSHCTYLLRSFSLYDVWLYLFNGKSKDAQIVNFLKTGVYIHISHNHYDCFFFLSRPLFSISTSLFIHAQFFSPSATFSKPAPYSQSANFYCIFCWTARWPLKKTTQWLCFSAVILICVSFPLDCHCVLPDYLPALHLLTALLGELAILRHSRRSHMWEKSRSQIAWGRVSWFPFQATVEWIEVFMQTAPYNILSIAQTTWSYQPRFFCSMVIRIRNSQQIFMLNVINAIRFLSFN